MPKIRSERHSPTNRICIQTQRGACLQYSARKFWLSYHFPRSNDHGARPQFAASNVAHIAGKLCMESMLKKKKYHIRIPVRDHDQGVAP